MDIPMAYVMPCASLTLGLYLQCWWPGSCCIFDPARIKLTPVVKDKAFNSKEDRRLNIPKKDGTASASTIQLESNRKMSLFSN